MAKVCRRCNREYRRGESRQTHVCDIVTIKLKSDAEGTSNRTVHTSRVEKGGDLYEDVNNGDWHIVYRNKTRVEKLFEEQQTAAREQKELDL